MNKKILFVLFAALVVSVAAYFYLKNKDKNKPLETEPGGTQTPGTIPYNPKSTASNLPATPMQFGKFPLRYGSVGKAVKFFQVMLGINADGIWGNTTDIAMKRFFSTVKDKDNEISITEFVTYIKIGAGTQSWPLRKGSTGNYVSGLQIMLDLPIDGKFGANTEAATQKALGRNYCDMLDFQNLLTQNFTK